MPLVRVGRAHRDHGLAERVAREVDDRQLVVVRLDDLLRRPSVRRRLRERGDLGGGEDARLVAHVGDLALERTVPALRRVAEARRAALVDRRQRLALHPRFRIGAVDPQLRRSGIVLARRAHRHRHVRPGVRRQDAAETPCTRPPGHFDPERQAREVRSVGWLRRVQVERRRLDDARIRLVALAPAADLHPCREGHRLRLRHLQRLAARQFAVEAARIRRPCGQRRQRGNERACKKAAPPQMASLDLLHRLFLSAFRPPERRRRLRTGVCPWQGRSDYTTSSAKCGARNRVCDFAHVSTSCRLEGGFPS